ncbi:Non-phosphorylating glyceraldehyde-3-phosphate dehydrogenase (NADP) [Streptococcus sp. DD04]|nr:Non-phosphorylating glyceraldehyde-3-phosphate dehydrogenase (NADP) [Streptococcus sp. DD04]
MQYKNYINGEWKSSEKEITISSPINNEVLGTIPAMTQAEVDYAMAQARAALPAWRALSAVERAAYLHKVADILERDQKKLAKFLQKKLQRELRPLLAR